MLHPWLYSMMCDNKPSEEFSTEDVTDPDVMGHLQKVIAEWALRCNGLESVLESSCNHIGYLCLSNF